MPYGTDLGMRAHWDDCGYSSLIPADLSALRRRASTFVDGLGWRMTAAGVPISRFPGKPAAAGQENEWPRTGASDVYGNEFAEDEVPGYVIRATYEAALYEAQNAGMLNAAIRSDERVVREKFDVVEFQYAEPQGSQMVGVAPSMPVIPAVLTILAPVLMGSGNSYGITGVVA